MYSDPIQQLNTRYVIQVLHVVLYLTGFISFPIIQNTLEWETGYQSLQVTSPVNFKLIYTIARSVFRRRISFYSYDCICMQGIFLIYAPQQNSVLYEDMLFNITTILKIHKQKKLFINHLYIFKFYMQRIICVSPRKQTCQKCN